jgi:phosphatidylglycerophosphate synthase
MTSGILLGMSPSLHTAGEKPEWAEVPVANRNRWQRIAAATNGRLTPPSVVTLAGLIMVIFGLNLLANTHYLAGLVLLAAGRAADILDGWLAEVTRTKSPFGEKLDATVDKIATSLTLLVLPLAGIVPWWAVIALAIPQALASVVAIVALRRGIFLHPTRIGKNGMAASWLSLLSFVLATIYPQATIWRWLAYLLLIAGVSFALLAVNGYRQTMAAHRKT